jgi:hypothetical protein
VRLYAYPISGTDLASLIGDGGAFPEGSAFYSAGHFGPENFLKFESLNDIPCILSTKFIR